MRALPAARFRSGAFLLAFYGLMLIANAAFYASWSGDFSDLTPRFWMRLLFVAALIHGLWQSSAWARWLTIAFGVVSGVSGLFAVWAASQTGLFDERPYPIVDYLVFILTSVVLLAAATVLLLPPRNLHGLSKA